MHQNKLTKQHTFKCFYELIRTSNIDHTSKALLSNDVEERQTESQITGFSKNQSSLLNSLLSK